MQHSFFALLGGRLVAAATIASSLAFPRFLLTTLPLSLSLTLMFPSLLVFVAAAIAPSLSVVVCFRHVFLGSCGLG